MPSSECLLGMEGRDTDLPTSATPGTSVRQASICTSQNFLLPGSLREEDRMFDLNGCLEMSIVPMEEDPESLAAWPLPSTLSRQWGIFTK